MARRKLLTTEQVVELERMAGIGLSQEHAALVFGMSKDTLHARIVENQKGAGDAWQRGKAVAATKVLSTLWRLIEEGSPAAVFFYCKTQLGWRETKVVEGHVTIDKLLAELDEEDADDSSEPEPE